MQVIVTGWRSSSEGWLRAQQLPAQDLPHLSEEQKAIAREFGASEEDYARSVYAAALCRRELLAKTERLGELLETTMRAKFLDASVQMIELRTFDGNFQIVAIVRGQDARLRISEELVDELLVSGSKELEARLARIVELSLPSVGAVRAS
jgi:hypothetical protein